VTTSPERWLSVAQAAELMACTRTHIYDLVGSGELRGYKLRGKVRTPHHGLKIALSDLEAYRKKAYAPTRRANS